MHEDSFSVPQSQRDADTGEHQIQVTVREDDSVSEAKYGQGVLGAHTKVLAMPQEMNLQFHHCGLSKEIMFCFVVAVCLAAIVGGYTGINRRFSIVFTYERDL